jgi:hypothetical protein
VKLQELRAALEQGLAADWERLLAACWHELEIGLPDHGFESYKLLNRTENLSWKPPLLTFDIERHGPTACGSVYAEVHSWEVDVESGTARIVGTRRRQVHPRAERFDVRRLAEDVAAHIIARKEDPRLAWKGNVVCVRMGQVVPETNKQTTADRRQRFRLILDELLEARAWLKVRANTYRHEAQQV